MATAAQKQYVANFAVGAKLLASFKTTMAQAEKRMKALEAQTTAVSNALKAVGNTLLSLAGIVGGLSLAKMLKGAVDLATKEEERLKAIQVLLLKNNAIRAHGGGDMRKALAFAKEQTDLIDANNIGLAKEGVLRKSVYDELAKQLAIGGVPTKQIMHSVGAMGDLLVAIKGVSASEEDAAEFGAAMNKAIFGGQGRGLRQYGIFLDKDWKNQYVTFQARLDDIMSRLAFAQGESIRRATDAIGRIAVAKKEIENLGRQIGYDLLPIVASAATEIGAMVTRLEQPDAVANVNDLTAAIQQLQIAITGQPAEEGSIGQLLGGGFTAEIKIMAYWIRQFALDWEKSKMIMEHFWIGLKVSAETVFKLVGQWLKQFLTDPFQAFVDRWKDFLATIHLGKASKTTTEAIKSVAQDNARRAVDPRSRGIVMPPGLTPELQKAYIEGYYGPTSSYPKPAFVAPPQAAAGAAAAATGAGTLASVAASNKLEPYKKVFEEAGAQYGIDPRLLMAIAQQENVAARDLNPLGISPGGGGAAHYADMAAAREAIFKQVALMSRGIYEGKGPYRKASTLAELAQIYSPIGAANDIYGTNATELSGWQTALRKMGADPNMPLRAGGGDTHHYNFTPSVIIHGDATDEAQRAMDTRLRDLSQDFIEQMTRAQRQARRTSYEGGYS